MDWVIAMDNLILNIQWHSKSCINIFQEFSTPNVQLMFNSRKSVRLRRPSSIAVDCSDPNHTISHCVLITTIPLSSGITSNMCHEKDRGMSLLILSLSPLFHPFICSSKHLLTRHFHYMQASLVSREEHQE